MRKERSFGASFAATCVGVRKNTRFDWNAFNTRVAAMPRAPSPATIQIARLVLGFKLTLLFDAAQRTRAAPFQCHDLHQHRDCERCVGHGDVETVGMVHVQPAASARAQCVRRSRSRMMARTRVSEAPIE